MLEKERSTRWEGTAVAPASWVKAASRAPQPAYTCNDPRHVYVPCCLQLQASSPGRDNQLAEPRGRSARPNASPYRELPVAISAVIDERFEASKQLSFRLDEPRQRHLQGTSHDHRRMRRQAL